MGVYLSTGVRVCQGCAHASEYVRVRVHVSVQCTCVLRLVSTVSVLRLHKCVQRTSMSVGVCVRDYARIRG